MSNMDVISLLYARSSMMIMRVLFVLITYCSLAYSDCGFDADDVHNKDAQAKIKKWDVYGKNFTVTKDGISYSVGICAPAVGSTNNASIIQTEANDSYVLGKLDNVNLVARDNWILLTYENGDRYVNECDNITRSASIIFICGENKNNVTILQDHTSKDHHCNYMFQLQIPDLCPIIVPVQNKLSGGAIFVIVISCVAVAYLVGGALFMHIKRGARGIDRIPNLEMWRNCGSLAADGCDFCCRCNVRSQRAGYFLDESGSDLRGDDDILAP